MIITKCDQCGIEIKKRNRDVKYLTHFCSNECKLEFHKAKPKIKVNCCNCDKEFEVFPHKINNGYNLYCSHECYLNYINNSKIINCSQCNKEISIPRWRQGQDNYFCNQECKGKYWSDNFNGENSTHWKGGVTPIRFKMRTIRENLEWRDACLIRDDYTCQTCSLISDNLQVHHVKHFVNILEENNVETIEQARNCPELWNIDNGITLCVDCHKLEHITRGKI